MSSPPGGRFESGGDPGAGALVGAVSEDRDALTLADSDDAVGAGYGEVVSKSIVPTAATADLGDPAAHPA